MKNIAANLDAFWGDALYKIAHTAKLLAELCFCGPKYAHIYLDRLHEFWSSDGE